MAGAISKNVGTVVNQVKKGISELEKDLNTAVNDNEGLALGDEESLGIFISTIIIINIIRNIVII